MAFSHATAAVQPAARRYRLATILSLCLLGALLCASPVSAQSSSGSLGASRLNDDGIVLAQAPADAPPSNKNVSPHEAPPAPRVEVADPGAQLSPSDAQTLRQQTARVQLPASVRTVAFVSFSDISADNLNDAVLEWAGAAHPDFVPDGTGKGAKWAPGLLLIAVSTGAREVGIYCGDDVCSELDLFSGKHLDKALAEMKPPLRDDRNNVAVAMLNGLRTAADPSAVVEDKHTFSPLLFGGLIAMVGAFGLFFVAQGRKLLGNLRAQFEEVSREFGDVAQRLDQIDIRANSLTSPLADAELRRQWEKIRADFVAVGTIVSDTGLTLNSKKREFWRHRKEIEKAHTAMRGVQNAEANIEKIFRMEHGDDAARHQELTNVIEDIVTASSKTKDRDLKARLNELEKQAKALRDRLDTTDFMAEFAAIVRSYAHLLDLVRKSELDSLKMDEDDRHAPRIYEHDYRVGYGYGNWVPYSYMSAWHQADRSAASSSSTNSSFSSGFSGGGGSSGY